MKTLKEYLLFESNLHDDIEKMSKILDHDPIKFHGWWGHVDDYNRWQISYKKIVLCLITNEKNNNLFSIINSTKIYNFINNKWEIKEINGKITDKDIKSKLDDLHDAFTSKDIDILIDDYNKIQEKEPQKLSYNEIIKKIDAYKDSDSTGIKISKDELEQVKKILDPYKSKSFIYVCDSLDDEWYDIIDDEYTPDEDKNTLDYVYVGEESWVSILKHKRKIYFAFALDLNQSILYLIK